MTIEMLQREMEGYFNDRIIEIEIELLRMPGIRQRWAESSLEKDETKLDSGFLFKQWRPRVEPEIIIALAPKYCRDFADEVICESDYTVWHSELDVYAELVIAGAIAIRLTHWGSSIPRFFSSLIETQQVSSETIALLLKQELAVRDELQSKNDNNEGLSPRDS